MAFAFATVFTEEGDYYFAFIDDVLWCVVALENFFTDFNGVGFSGSFFSTEATSGVFVVVLEHTIGDIKWYFFSTSRLGVFALFDVSEGLSEGEINYSDVASDTFNILHISYGKSVVVAVSE